MVVSSDIFNGRGCVRGILKDGMVLIN
jgi:hypothetical protein